MVIDKFSTQLTFKLIPIQLAFLNAYFYITVSSLVSSYVSFRIRRKPIL